MLEKLKKEVYEANIRLKNENLVIFTWGNVSGIDESGKYVVIKPSGVEYNSLTPEMMIVCDLNGKVVEGDLNPSSDLMTHLEIYKACPEIKGVCHTHSHWATIWSQSKRSIPNYGTTHSDYFENEIFCSRAMTKDEIEKDYELNTGKLVRETIGNRDFMKNKAILIASHGPFTWGNSPKDSVDTAIVLEHIAEMAKQTEDLNLKITEIDSLLKEKHFNRKHGENSYYGQGRKV